MYYADMLETGRIMVDGKLHVPWNRAHFGAWCVVSAPLILGMDLTKQDAVAAVIDVIANEEAIAVNQAWAGHPGGLVWSGLGGALGFPAARKCNLDNPGLKQAGWSLKPLASTTHVALGAPGGGCLKQQGAGFEGGAGGLIIADCNITDPAQIFDYDATTMQLKQVSTKHCVDVHASGPIVWMYGCTPKANDQLMFNKTTGTVSLNMASGLCFGVEAGDPAGATYASTLQAWVSACSKRARAHALTHALPMPGLKPLGLPTPVPAHTHMLMIYGWSCARGL